MIVLGRVVAPYGIKGWLRVDPHADDPAQWIDVETWLLSPHADAPADQWQPHVIETARWAGGKLDVKLGGIDDRAAAETHKGWFVGLPRDAMPANAPDEYYWDDLVGLAVVNRANEPLGRVVRLIETGANDVLVVADGETERLVPFIASAIVRVDFAAGLIVVDWERDW